MSTNNKPQSGLFSLQSDNGAEYTFTGKIFSESSYYDEEYACLTKLRLFLTDDSILVYSIVTSGESKARRYYTVQVKDESCLMNDGITNIVVPVDMLFGSVFGLCGIDPSRAEELRLVFEETLRAVSS